MHRSKYALMGSVAICAALSAWSGTAFAQAKPAEAKGASSESQVSEVTVTGSRIIQDGTDAPTPVEVVGAAEIGKQATGDVAALLGTLPAFSGNSQANNQATTSNATAALVGQNLANLRGLGVNRTLVLIDGQRFVPTLTYGSNAFYAVDLGGIPQQLIQRVETVTGGASAVYGSDAVGGAVNFILNKNFTGLMVDASGGSTTYWDDQNEKLNITYGVNFANDRGHFIISGESYSNSGVDDIRNRGWAHAGLCVMTNPAFSPTNGQPLKITVPQCGENSAPGGVINTGPLKGTTFGPGGVPGPFQYGSLVSTPLMSGGSWQLASNDVLTRGDSLDPSERRQNVFTVLSYDLTEKVRATYTFSWAHTSSYTHDPDMFFDSAGGVTIKSDNAFIPASLRPALVGTPSFILSTLNGDLTDIQAYTSRFVERHSFALDGDFDLFKSNWVWDAYYTFGKTRNLVEDFSLSRSRYANATDAIFAPNGSIVCRNGDPACVPFDLFGLGVNSAQAIKYVNDVGAVHQSNIQQVLAASITGHPFSLWAGPIGVAFSAEYRKESAKGVSNAEALANDLYSGNYKPINGKDDVKEAALEIAIPLAKDWVLAKSANLDLAVRETDYSTSGSVTTWKVGATWSPIEEIVIRGNVSHDIRAANLGELYAFAGAPVVTPGLLDPFTNTSNAIARVSSTGNPKLLPEEADSVGYGAVWKPSFLPGFSASLDYWRVAQKGQIASLSANQALQLCFAGNQGACAFITRSGTANLPGVGAYAGQFFAPLAFITTAYLNIATVNSSGLDEFAAYNFPLRNVLPFDGDVTLRYIGSYYFEGYTNPGVPGALPTRTAAFWRAIVSANYNISDWQVGLSARYASKNTYVAGALLQTVICASNCPAQTSIPANYTTQNYVANPSTLFLDVNLSRNLKIRDYDTQVYLNVRNLLNKDPPSIPPGAEPFSISQSAVGGDDTLGRIIRIGIRIRK